MDASELQEDAPVVAPSSSLDGVESNQEPPHVSPSDKGKSQASHEHDSETDSTAKPSYREQKAIIVDDISSPPSAPDFSSDDTSPAMNLTPEKNQQVPGDEVGSPSVYSSNNNNNQNTKSKPEAVESCSQGTSLTWDSDDSAAPPARSPSSPTPGVVEGEEDVRLSVRALRLRYEKKMDPPPVVPGPSNDLLDDHEKMMIISPPRRHSVSGRFTTPNHGSSNDDSVSELSGPQNSEPGIVGGGLEVFFRQQKLQKFAERQKLKETWNRYHCDKEEEVVVSLLTQPSVQARDYASDSAHPVLVDYRHRDYRAFIFLLHDAHGLLLLHCTRKKKKPAHYQVPGGHVDEAEFIQAARNSQERLTQLMMACKACAARELFEETGIDIRNDLDRLDPAQLRSLDQPLDQVQEKAVNELKDRLFFFLEVNDENFPKEGVAPQGERGSNLRLKLSDEHSGFLFEPEPRKAAEMLHEHSGGKCSEALLLTLNTEKEGVIVTATASADSAKESPNEESLTQEFQAELEVLPKPKKQEGLFCCFTWGWS